MLNNLKQLPAYMQALAHIWFPSLCLLCRKTLQPGENQICFTCIQSFPVTNFYRTENNDLTKRLAGRVELNHATAYLYFYNRGIVQRIVHLLKYKGKTQVGVMIGQMVAHTLLHKDSIIKAVEVIVPVPLHWKREKARGYNQSDFFAQGISDVLNVPVEKNTLVRKQENISQTKHSRYGRWENVDGIFAVHNFSTLENKHVLLVDDVITTGSTIEACCYALGQAKPAKISVCCLAAAGRA